MPDTIIGRGFSFLLAKPSFRWNYTDASAKLEDICPLAKKQGFNAFLKHRNLDAWMQRCL
ncbi:hypothetical protein HYX14_05575 [Candidatus Woesearchaeota archaeon]|nr:hypothetical protein [Candidatus Woesearchaeota archaeon]